MRQTITLNMEKARLLAYKIPHTKLWSTIDSSPLDLHRIKISQTINPGIVEVRLYSKESDVKDIFYFYLAQHIQGQIFGSPPVKGKLQKVALPPPKGKLQKFVG